jgi:hypothetical protein
MENRDARSALGGFLPGTFGFSGLDWGWGLSLGARLLGLFGYKRLSGSFALEVACDVVERAGQLKGAGAQGFMVPVCASTHQLQKQVFRHGHDLF